MGFKYKPDKLKSSGLISRSGVKLWIVRAVTTILLWTCAVQLIALGDMFKGWPSCLTTHSDLPSLRHHFTKFVLPPKSKFSCFGFHFWQFCSSGLVLFFLSILILFGWFWVIFGYLFSLVKKKKKSLVFDSGTLELYQWWGLT